MSKILEKIESINNSTKSSLKDLKNDYLIMKALIIILILAIIVMKFKSKFI